MISPRTKFTALMLLLGICLIGPMVTPVAMAHTTVKSATLEDGGIYQSLPENFELVFAQKVGLAGLSITEANGQSVEMDYTPPKSMETKFSISLPDLNSGQYTLSWRAMAKDGHVLKGELTFTIQ